MFKKITLIAAAALLLAACDKKPETITLDFIELEKTNDLNRARAVYVSHDERAYYATYLTSYEYNNFEELDIDKSIEITLKSVVEQINGQAFDGDYSYVDKEGNEYGFQSIEYYRDTGDSD